MAVISSGGTTIEILVDHYHSSLSLNRREPLLLAAATLQQLARAEKPSAPAELCTAIRENLRAEDFTPPLPEPIREALRAHLLKTAPQPRRAAVLNE